jgi:hypothetical protein
MRLQLRFPGRVFNETPYSLPIGGGFYGHGLIHHQPHTTAMKSRGQVVPHSPFKPMRRIGSPLQVKVLPKHSCFCVWVSATPDS